MKARQAKSDAEIKAKQEAENKAISEKFKQKYGYEPAYRAVMYLRPYYLQNYPNYDEHMEFVHKHRKDW